MHMTFPSVLIWNQERRRDRHLMNTDLAELLLHGVCSSSRLDRGHPTVVGARGLFRQRASRLGWGSRDVHISLQQYS